MSTGNDFAKSIQTFPKHDLTFEALLAEDTILIKQGNQVIRIPGLGEDNQRVFDLFLMSNRNLQLAYETRMRFTKPKAPTREQVIRPAAGRVPVSTNEPAEVQSQASKEDPS